MSKDPIRLDDLYQMVSHIYNEQNTHRPASATFAHFVEVCGMLTVHDRQKRRESASVEDALCKAVGWFFPLLAKFHVSSVEELIYRKYPYVCPYCRRRPHEDSVCKTVRGTGRTVDHDALRRAYEDNRDRRPVSLIGWQRMFQDIYPRSVEDRSARSTVGLFEELGELAEAVRVFERYPKYFAGEAADVFSYLMGIANEHSLKLERDDRSFSFEEEFIKRYPGLCVQCGYSVCVCPSVPDSTVGRMAKELDTAHLDTLFQMNPDEFRKHGVSAANSVLDRLGGYSALTTQFPFDRGETNKALVVLCLKLADRLDSVSAEVADRLRSTALKIANAETYAGSPHRLQNFAELIAEVQNAMPELGGSLSELLSPITSLPNQVGRLLDPGKVRVLLVLPSPEDTPPLRLASEERAIREAIELANAGESIVLRTLPAATVDDLRRALMKDEYEIVHFSGHGQPAGLIFETANGQSAESPLEAVADLIRRYPKIKCVILSACDSLASLTSPISHLTIGMEAAVDDKAAIEFSRGFYGALAERKSVQFAIDEGKSAVALKGLGNFPLKVIPS